MSKISLVCFEEKDRETPIFAGAWRVAYSGERNPWGVGPVGSLRRCPPPAGSGFWERSGTAESLKAWAVVCHQHWR